MSIDIKMKMKIQYSLSFSTMISTREYVLKCDSVSYQIVTVM